MQKNILTIGIVVLSLLVPHTGKALSVGELLQGNGDSSGLTARSYLVVDNQTGEILAARDPELPWVPASITKLVTVMVVLDTKPNLNKTIAMNASDRIAGGCQEGGACLYTKDGVRYRIKDLMYAALVASANNAAHALARSTGMSDEKFVERMNAKAASLGAVNTRFTEMTGMDPGNITTASDYSKITSAAFQQPQIRTMATAKTYTFRSTNNSRYSHTVKNTNKLLADADVQIVGGKTGYLDESRYNFVTVLKDRFLNEFTVVVMGSQSSSTEFSDTKRLVELAGMAKAFNSFLPVVMGTSTGITNN